MKAGEVRQKQCTKCKKSKSLSKFVRTATAKDGHGHECLECKRTRSLAYNRKRRLLIIDHYTGGKMCCACCGEGHLEFLSIDHTNGGGAKHRKQIGQRLEHWLWKMGLPKGFRILCHNCNQSLGAYGYCPHQSDVRTFQYEAERHAPQNTSKLTPTDMRNIKRRVADGELQYKLAEEYKVSKATVCLVVNDRRGRLYK